VQRRHQFTPRLGRTARALGAVLGVLLAAVVVWAGFAWARLTADLPSIQILPTLLDRQTGQMLQPTRLFDRTGQHLLYTFENPGIPRRFLPVDPALSGHFEPLLVQYMVELYDPTFWQHPGFDWRSLTDPQPHTLAERLVSDLLLEQEPPSLQRALRMRLLAAQVVSRYGRGQVLEWALNSTSYGHLTYGADSAARLYLGKPATDLSLAETALLLAVSQAPALNPLDAPAAALENQQQVLALLHDRGLIPEADYAAAAAEALDLQPALEPANPVAVAFSNLVINQLGAQFGSQRVERGGLTVITSLDYETQLQLQCALQTQLARLQGQLEPESLPDGRSCDMARLLPTLSAGQLADADLAFSAALLDPANGQVLALLGDTTLDEEQSFLTGHQPGSLLTPFVGVAAFARGFAPASLMWDIPPAGADQESPAANPDGRYHGPVRLRVALANDYVVPLINLADQIGVLGIWRTAESLGLSGLSTAAPDADLLTSGGSLTVLQAAQGYSSFATLGLLNGRRAAVDEPLQPVLILLVQDSSGRVLLDQQVGESQPVLSQPLAYLITHVLSDESARWPSLGHPNLLEIGRPAGAHLGQIADATQAWTVGYTPQRVAVVWAGSDIALNSDLSASLWHALMQYTHGGRPVENWTMPSGLQTVDVCDPSGMLPTVNCPNVVSELFMAGSEPVMLDTLYQSLQVNRETGRLATVFTPPEQVEARVYLMAPPEAQAWARWMGLPLPPIEYDAIQAPPPLPNVQVTSPGLYAYVRGVVPIIGTAAGTDFASYTVQVGQGINPRSWMQVGQASESMVVGGELAAWDTTDLEGLYAIRLVVVRDDSQVDSAILQVTVDNTAPLVESPYPLADQTITPPTGQIVTLQAAVQEAVGVNRVEWWVDGTLAGLRQGGEGLTSGDALAFSLPWSAAPGRHTLVIKAYDLAGNLGESESISFTVSRE